MEKNNGQICPVCSKRYWGFSAISRKDNKTEICPKCGLMEAINIAGLDEETKAQIEGLVDESKMSYKAKCVAKAQPDPLDEGTSDNEAVDD